MPNNVRQSRTFVTIIVLIAVSFVLWLFALFIVWAILQSRGSTTTFWAMTEALSTAVAAAGVLGAGYVAYRELSESSSSRHLEVADRLFNELNSQEKTDPPPSTYLNLPTHPQPPLHTTT